MWYDYEMAFNPRDHYFKKAKKDQFLARSIYKLEEIDEKFKIISEADNVLDVGYHPGSWIQYTSQVIGPKGKIIGIDIREINKKLLGEKNITLFQKDIMDVKKLSDIGMNQPFDVVLSDMAPNTTGIRSVDQDRSFNLIEMLFSLLPKFLKNNGNMVAKVFDSNDAQAFLKEQKQNFQQFKYLKPKSTRRTSKEFFVIGNGYKA